MAATPPPESAFDVRVVERNLDEGKLSAAQYEKHLKQLPDDADEAETSSVNMVLRSRPRAAVLDEDVDA
jgi:hypothetical protein